MASCVFLVSAAIVVGLFAFGLDYILFPAFAGFMVVGPIARHRPLREEPAHRGRRRRSSLARHDLRARRIGRADLFTGVLLCLLMLLWMRAAVIIYALFFGLLPFPGLSHVAACLFTTPTGWALLIVGTRGRRAVRGLLLRHQRLLRSRCCSTSGSTR